MVDKLVKTGHKKGYYRARRFSIFATSFLFFSLAVSTPVIIAKHVAEVRKAEEEIKTSIPETSESSTVEISEYQY